MADVTEREQAKQAKRAISSTFSLPPAMCRPWKPDHHIYHVHKFRNRFSSSYFATFLGSRFCIKQRKRRTRFKQESRSRGSSALPEGSVPSPSQGGPALIEGSVHLPPHTRDLQVEAPRNADFRLQCGCSRNGCFCLHLIPVTRPPLLKWFSKYNEGAEVWNAEFRNDYWSQVSNNDFWYRGSGRGMTLFWSKSKCKKTVFFDPLTNTTSFRSAGSSGSYQVSFDDAFYANIDVYSNNAPTGEVTPNVISAAATAASTNSSLGDDRQ